MKKVIFVLSFIVLFVSQAGASDVLVWGEALSGFDPNTINNFYNSLPGTTSTIGVGKLNTNNLSGIELLWATQPADAYDAAELATMASFLSSGGRIAFMGEHGDFGWNEDVRIQAALTYLGAHITINQDSPDGGYHDATVVNGQILAHTLTAGVNDYNYACFASLNLSGAAQALMVGTDHSQVMMGYENIGAGSIFLITDQNVWDNVGASTNDNKIMFKNLLLADTGAPPVTTPEPGTIALLIFGLAGIAGLRRKFNK